MIKTRGKKSVKRDKCNIICVHTIFVPRISVFRIICKKRVIVNALRRLLIQKNDDKKAITDIKEWQDRNTYLLRRMVLRRLDRAKSVRRIRLVISPARTSTGSGRAEKTSLYRLSGESLELN